MWEWKEHSGGSIQNQLRRLGCSCDWERERFTLDEGLSRAVHTVFATLYKEGLIYQGYRIINWCPRCETALSDIETEYQDLEGHLWHIRYPIAGTEEFIVVATTRPETMLGDTGVAVNPDDERYTDLVGKMVILPLMNREIPVFADHFVDKEFGTGLVKVTPAHDPNDFDMGKRHGLEEINILDKNAVHQRKRRAVQGTVPLRGARRRSWRTSRRRASWSRSRSTFTPSGTATAATPSSSRTCPSSGS